MTSYSIQPLAYLKVVLHAAKWQGVVTGLLVGTFDPISKAAIIEDAIPLLHHWTELSPMMEAGLQLAEIHARAKGQVFLGLYVANEGVEDTTVPPTTVSVAEAIRKEFTEAIVLVLDNSKLATTSSALILNLPSPSGWSPTSTPLVLVDPESPAKALVQVRAGKYSALGDFDDHVENVTVDWLGNTGIVP